jgi:hypothetical protein
MGRLVWFHVPPLVTPKTAQEIASGKAERNTDELLKVMAEKRMALDLIEACVLFVFKFIDQLLSERRFAVATKHHLRGKQGFDDLDREPHSFLPISGELGIYYEDLYHLLRPLREGEVNLILCAIPNVQPFMSAWPPEQETTPRATSGSCCPPDITSSDIFHRSYPGYG